MDIKAWFRIYLDEHRPDGNWSLQADWAARCCLQQYAVTGDEACRAYVIAWADSLVAADASRSAARRCSSPWHRRGRRSTATPSRA